MIATEVNDSIFLITLDRPDRLNAFTVAMQRALCDALDEADADPKVRAVIFTGRGRAFCAGHDLEPGAETFAATEGGQRNEGGLLTLRIFQCTKPVVAAVNGAAVGIGATMTLPMDVRLASESARFGFVFARRGIVPEAASSWFLPRVVGISTALEWTMTGRVFDAAEAHRAGLLRSVLPAEELIPAAVAIGHEIATHTSAVSVAVTRQMMWRMLGASHPMEAHRVDSNALHLLGRSDDAREGVESFLEKREARFVNRVPDDLPAPWPFWREPRWSEISERLV